ncbi:proton-coupled amino acid transporter-like protein pathetic isoform X1 [Tribolium madens]|uniref:proton-coupled amino acid transporter-like protein pathetic isoform X1 n=1 Tax=Tribolium madens TaxID=41895 RepID=UPI001CF72BB2|nr:proton-coupled amino acid transporter-like protein pathetic isoform X1 [Tribolium madens]
MSAKVLQYNSHELETFLPHSQPTYINPVPTQINYYGCSYEANLKQYLLAARTTRYGSVYKSQPKFIYIRPSPQADVKVTLSENEKDLNPVKEDFDPFKARHLDQPVSSGATLTHLLKSSLGTGILSMPAAFKASGLWLGVFTTILVSLICTHTAYALVSSAHALYRKAGKTSMSYAEVAEEACLRGPPWSKKYAFLLKQLVLWGIFVTYYATGSCYAVIVAENFNYVAFNYLGNFDKRITIAMLFLPFLLIAYVPNLKYLAPVSMVANCCMAVGLGITCYYLLSDIPSISDRPAVTNLATLPVCISIVIFAIEAIGVVMPLENNMKSPQKFVGLFGVLNQGMTYVTILYIILGFLGYLKYGELTADSITLNLPREEYAAQAVNLLIGLAVFFTYGLVFYVCLDIFWSEIKHRYTSKTMLANYVLRTVLVMINIVIAILVPAIVPFVGLIGAFCFSILGLVCPVIIEIFTFWDQGFGRFYWKLFKHVIVVCMALLAVVFGSKAAISDIAKTF